MRASICSLPKLPLGGITTSISTIRLPKFRESLKKGIPNPLSTFFSWSEITSLLIVEICWFDPSKCLMSNENPVRASKRETFFLKNRSAPTRVKIGWFLIATTNMTSPAKQSGSSSPSPGSVITCSFGVPFSTETYRIFYFSRVFSPLHDLHLFFSSIVVPSPLHDEQCCWNCWIIGPIWTVLTVTPLPLQSLQVWVPLPPFPWQTSQHLDLLTGIFFTHPL